MTIFAQSIRWSTPYKRKQNGKICTWGLDSTTFDCKDDVILLSDWSPYSQGTSRDVFRTDGKKDKSDDYGVSYHIYPTQKLIKSEEMRYRLLVVVHWPFESEVQYCESLEQR